MPVRTIVASRPSIPDKKYNEVPVLCYHNISKSPAKENELWISESHFDKQMGALYDSGYHTISPAELYDHYTKGAPLPAKPVMITFDDTHEEHFTVAARLLEKYRYRGVFFIMTVCIGKKKYLTTQQIGMLAEKGHFIGNHTYDHPMITSLTGKQWEQQIDKPKKTLERITGKPVEYFAYPNGIWNEQAAMELGKHGIKVAFQLAGKPSSQVPLLTIRRILVSGNWSGQQLLKQMAGRRK